MKETLTNKYVKHTSIYGLFPHLYTDPDKQI